MNPHTAYCYFFVISISAIIRNENETKASTIGTDVFATANPLLLCCGVVLGSLFFSRNSTSIIKPAIAIRIYIRFAAVTINEPL